MYNNPLSRATYLETKRLKDVNDIGKEIIKWKNVEINKRNKAIANLNNELDDERSKNESIKEENEILKKRIQDLEEDNDRIRKELDLKTIQINKDSSNSNWSSSTNHPWVKTKKHIYSSREKSNLKVGGQTNHEGHFGKLCLNPDEIIIHINEQPPCNGIVDVLNNKVIQQIKEIEFKTKIIQHEYTFNDGTDVSRLALLPNAFTYGDSVNSFIILLCHEGYVSFNRIASFISELTNSGLEISESYISNLNLKFVNNLSTAIQQIQEDVKDTNVLHFDETSVKVNGTQNAIQGYANKNTTYLFATKHKCDETIFIFLNNYRNWLVVDYAPGYQKLETHAKIAGCNAHIERYLKLCANDYQVSEAKQMLTLLTKANRNKNLLQPKDIQSIKNQYNQICDAYLDKYDKLNQNDQFYFHDVYLIFKRLKLKAHQHLAFLTNHEVPYTNNEIERDFRHTKTKMKVSGTFRDWNHLVAFTVIRSFLQTCHKRKINIWQAINKTQTSQFSFY